MISPGNNRTQSPTTELLGLSIESLTSPSLMHKFVIKELYDEEPGDRYYDYLCIKFKMNKVLAAAYVHKLIRYSVMYKTFITNDSKIVFCGIQLWKSTNKALVTKLRNNTTITSANYTLAKIIKRYKLINKLNEYIDHNTKMEKSGNLKSLKLRISDSLAAHSM